MAAKTERIKVEVTDSTEGETRTFRITLTAPNNDFQLTDLLRQRGVISALNGDLKQAVRVATENYLTSAETLISSLTQVSTAAPKTRSNAKGNGGKSRRNGARSAQASAPPTDLSQATTDKAKVPV